MNSLWLILTAVAAFAVAYRFYGAFLAARVAVLDDRRVTPAHALHDGVDFHSTKKLVLFGHHFAAIAGPGPLIGPVLAAQWGYLPGFSWIVIGACLAGAVHDFVILVASVRDKGRSLPGIARDNIGPVAGLTTCLATLFIIIAVLASVAIVIVNALSESAWGMFTIILTVPAAMLTGLWMTKIRPGRVLEASLMGMGLVLAGVMLGKPFAESEMGPMLVFSKPALSIILPAYSALAAILPVWLLLVPRDYLSSYMKIGVMAVLAVGIVVANPPLRMPAMTPFIDGTGPVVSGAIWPFVCIVIMCGALSGFHALVASGTTPKMVDKESDIRPIGYGAMIMEGFVAVTALVAACALQPGDYFAINVPQDKPAQVEKYQKFLGMAQSQHQWNLQPTELKELEKGTGEKLVGRTGGAVTLAVGMAKVFSEAMRATHLMDYWYHFVIMFEALFILTLLETGTRVARFVFQETITQIRPADEDVGRKLRWGWNIVLSLVVCFLWGYLLYTGNLNALWRMLGIANQLLAIIGLAVGTTYLLNHAPKRKYAWCTAIPLVFVVITVFAAGVESIGMWWAELSSPQITAAAAFNVKLMCVLAAIMLLLCVIILGDAVRRWYVILFSARSLATRSLAAATETSNPL